MNPMETREEVRKYFVMKEMSMFIEADGLKELLNALSDVCFDKCKEYELHNRVNIAKEWEDVSKQIGDLADSPAIKALS